MSNNIYKYAGAPLTRSHADQRAKAWKQKNLKKKSFKSNLNFPILLILHTFPLFLENN